MAHALSELKPPVDPRLTWTVPKFGELPQTSDLDEVASRVIAPNASQMTLDGTNTYVVVAPGTGDAVVVDPGPDDPAHRDRVSAVLAARDAACAGIVVTHHHLDHCAAAQAWATAYGCKVAAPTAKVAGEDGRVVHDGDTLTYGELVIRVVGTPGHCSDHTAYRLPNDALLVGDHILGRGTSVVTFPEGDLTAYLESLRRVLQLGPDALYPGHGPDMTEDPSAVVKYYLDHRAFREQQILAVLAEGPAAPRAMVERIYADVDSRLWRAAESSTRACLDKLAKEGVVEPDGDTFKLA